MIIQVSAETIKNQLQTMYKICLKNADKMAIFVYYGIDYYITSNHAPADFVRKFTSMDECDIEYIVNKCLRGRRISNEDIVTVFKRHTNKIAV